MEKLIVDNNLNRYAYEGVARHQEIKKLVTAKWEEYEKCVEDVETIEEAKKCAGNKEQEDKLDDNNEVENNQETETDKTNNTEETPELEEIEADLEKPEY